MSKLPVRPKDTTEAYRRMVLMQRRMDELEVKCGVTQAMLDRVMLEHCPEDMSKEQVKDFETHVAVSKDIEELQSQVKLWKEIAEDAAVADTKLEAISIVVDALKEEAKLNGKGEFHA